MTIDEANDIISAYEYFEEQSCVCFQGNPPCSKCVNQPDEYLYDEALKVYKEYYNDN